MLIKPRHVSLFKIWRSYFYNHYFRRIAASMCPLARQPLSNPRLNKSSIHQSWKAYQQFFLAENLPVWRLSRNQFEQKLPKITLHGNWGLLIPQNRYTCHKCVIWQIKGLIWFKVWLKHWKGLKLGAKSQFLDYNKIIFFLFLNIIFWKNLVIHTYT